MRPLTPEQIDDILPQTQCGLCGYGGCMPYAEALVFEKAAINLCPPGGVETLHQLGALLQQDATPFIEEMAQKAKPPLVAVVRESECIGCTKCIQACPVDAILGSAKTMHTIITDECTGCELCIPPCPVDCIDMIVQSPIEDSARQQKREHARQRFNTRQRRLTKEKKENKLMKMSDTLNIRKQYIQSAIARAKEKRAAK